MKTPDFKTRMLFVALMPVLLVSLAFSLFVIRQGYNAAEASLIERGGTLVRQLAAAAEYGAFSGNTSELKRLAEIARNETGVTAITLYDATGQPFVQLGQAQLRTPPARLADHWQGQNDSGSTLFFHQKIQRTAPSFDDPFNDPSRAATSTPAKPDPAQQMLGSVSVELSRDSVLRARQEILFATTLFSLLAVGVGSLLARRLSKNITEPIVALKRTVSHIHQGQLDARVPHHPQAILRGLEEGINEMAAALQAGRDHLEQRIQEATTEVRKQKEEAERINLAKTRFLAAASHDLRQPLHALTLFTDELAHYPDMNEQTRLLAHIRTAVDAMNQQLSALLDISRLDLGDIGIHRQPIPLQSLIERVASVHTPDAEAKGLRLRVVPTQAHTLSDPRLLESMLGNLVSNAVRYTQSGGILIGVRQRGENLHLEIWDTGIGIHPKQFALIFQEFYQVANLERDASKGLGIGLSIVARLSELLQHTVDVRSIPGRGTVFGITLPKFSVATQNETTTDSSATPLHPAPDKTLLILGKPPKKNDPHIGDLLTQWGYNVIHLENSAALENLSPPAPDALIFTAAEHQAVQRYAARQATSPLLIQLGASPNETHPAAEYPCTTLNLPLRPARLRALLNAMGSGLNTVRLS